ncbi:hypothetical protein [Parolsenella catena]|uniref:hypothetical protein n=1 Tax=Parolsenella catena TaxID=2003188 RepID=UPI002FDDA2E3
MITRREFVGIAFGVTLLPLAGCSSVPKDMDEWAYNVGKQAQSTWKDYKAGKTSPADACDAFKGYADQLNSLTSEDKMGSLYVMTAVGSLYWALDEKVNDKDSLVAPDDPDAWAAWLDNVLKGNYDNMPTD